MVKTTSLSKNLPRYSKLKKAQVKELLEKLNIYYNCSVEELYSYSFYITQRDKVYILSTSVEELDLERVNSFGLYFGTFHDNERFRLSIEGSALLKPTKNFVRINEETLKSYLAAESLFKEEVEEMNWQNHCPFLIVCYKDTNLGCVSPKEKELLNYIPKSRKLDFNKVF